MPSMKLFGRRWAVSSDDFVFPAVTEGIIRFLGFLIILCVYAVHPTDACPAAGHLNAYIAVALVHNAIIIVLSFTTAYVSSRGTIRNPTPRRRLPTLFCVRLVSLFFEFVWNIVGIVWLSRPSELTQCEPAVVAAGRLTLIGGWLMLGVFVVVFWVVFDPLGNVRRDDVKMTDQAKRLWSWRLHLLFCCATGGSDRAKTAFEDVAELLASFFGDTDLVFTDVLAGILLLANKDLTVMNARNNNNNNDPVVATMLGRGGAGGGRRPEILTENSSSQSSSDADDLPSWMSVHAASRMMEFALGVYGWPYYVCSHGCALQPLCDLLHKLRCCTQCRCDNVIVIKDNCCQCNTAAMLLHTGLADGDVFHVNLHNEIWETPFVACLDHRSKAIVVAIRGSLSLRDAITDLCMREDTFQLDDHPGLVEISGQTASAVGADGSGSGILVHKGMFWSARYVYSKLENEKVLDDLFVLQPDYDLVITGHSLGAGVAVLLAMLLKPKYANVRCFAFSPPGCVISENALPFTRDFVCSVIVGDDLIPRLSMHSMERFKSNILEVLDHCDRPKWEILLKGCFKLLCASKRRDAAAATITTAAAVAEVRGHNNDSGAARPGGGANSTYYDIVETITGNNTSNNRSNGFVRAHPTGTTSLAGGAALIAASTDSIDSAASHDEAPLIANVSRSRSVQSYTEERNVLASSLEVATVENGCQRATTTTTTTLTARKLLCPGRIMHVTQNSDNNDNLTIITTAIGASSTWRYHDYFSEIWLSSTMINDHMPYVVAAVLKEAAKASASPLLS